MPDSTASDVERAILALRLPLSGASLGESGAAIATSVTAGTLRVRVTVGFPAGALVDSLRTQIVEALRPLSSHIVEPEIVTAIVPHVVQGALVPLAGAKNVIAIASGKGGVGKSTTAVNIALALSAAGARVGILDADVYGPSQPLMLGLTGQQPESLDGKTFEPLIAHGVEVISVGFLVKEATPVIWRGPMVTQAVQQLAFQCNWHDRDYLVVDLPPGTGDTQLTLSQKVPLAGVVIVTTPQDIAVQVARRGLHMFEKVGVSVLGVIENMGAVVCSNCGHEEPVFGSGGGARLAAECGVTMLGSVPMAAAIRADTDGGVPTLVADPGGKISQRYREIAERIAIGLALRPADQRHKFPRIVVEDRK
jgi:ATP-binding protein involved in chromosome partitioning